METHLEGKDVAVVRNIHDCDGAEGNGPQDVGYS